MKPLPPDALLIQDRILYLMSLCHLLISKHQFPNAMRKTQLIQFQQVPNRRHGKRWREMSKKRTMKIHSNVIFILISPSLVRNSIDIPPGLRIKREMKLKRKQRILNLSISEMMGSRLHLYLTSLSSFFETIIGSQD